MDGPRTILQLTHDNLLELFYEYRRTGLRIASAVAEAIADKSTRQVGDEAELNAMVLANYLPAAAGLTGAPVFGLFDLF
jgi:hypothetical protein